MNKIIIGAIMVIGVLGLIWVMRPQVPNENSTAKISNAGLLSAEESNFDFGTVSMAAGKVNHVFKIKNSGTESAIVKKIYTSCMCTTVLLMHGDRKFGPYGMPGHGFVPSIDQTINSGEEVSIEVVFDPAAHGPAGIGQIQRTVVVENNSGEALEINFSALVTP